LSLGIECTRRGLGLVDRLLEALARDSVPRTAQDLDRRRYFARGSAPEDGVVRWARPAVEVERLSRAFDYGPFRSPWGRLTSRLGGRAVELGRLTPGSVGTPAPPGSLEVASDGSLEAATLDGWVRIRSVWVDGRRTDPDALLALGRRFAEQD
jgi:methionyl-tRNA formyltransferase